MLRADIHWRMENWTQVVNVLQRLSGEPQKKDTPLTNPRPKPF
tara:strand:- start:502 stop:630 length:129 start_codon:yes stop_codon:yes gene_type:complete